MPASVVSRMLIGSGPIRSRRARAPTTRPLRARRRRM
jgi:hypothetical protein